MPELTCTPMQAYEILRDCGFNIGYEKLRTGLQQNVFPFGVSIRMERGGWEYIIYSKDLNDFIRIHGGTEQRKEHP